MSVSWISYKKGVQEGVDKYHEVCYYNRGGFIVDEARGTIVSCQGLTRMDFSGKENIEQP